MFSVKQGDYMYVRPRTFQYKIIHIFICKPAFMNKLYVLFLVILPIGAFAQSDSLYKICQPGIFTRVEVSPNIKIEKSVYEDSLKQNLKRRYVVFNSGNIHLKFIVTFDGNIVEVKKISGNIEYDKEIGKSIIELSDLWKPGIQNGRAVCSYVELNIEFSNDDITVTVIPSGKH